VVPVQSGDHPSRAEQLWVPSTSVASSVRQGRSFSKPPGEQSSVGRIPSVFKDGEHWVLHKTQLSLASSK